jgi:ketosteroid isomerase-like protein
MKGAQRLGPGIRRKTDMTTTARDLAKASLEAVKAGKRDEWLALFDDDSIVEDPVGPSALDPAGQGHKGREAIARFYDTAIAGLKTFDYEIERTCLCGDEVAVLVSFRITTADGQAMVTDAMNVYRKAPNGKLAALRSFHHGS